MVKHALDVLLLFGQGHMLCSLGHRVQQTHQHHEEQDTVCVLIL